MPSIVQVSEYHCKGGKKSVNSQHISIYVIQTVIFIKINNYMTILISAGHNPEKKGACNDEYCEYDIASKWCEQIVELIDPIHPCELVPTGSLKDKVDFINNSDDVLLILELHFNSNIDAKGCEALYHPSSKKGKKLAEMLCNGFQERRIFLPNRGAKIGYYQMNPDKPIDYLLRKTKPIACIFEPEFISQKVNIKDNEEAACLAISDILLDFINKEIGIQI